MLRFRILAFDPKTSLLLLSAPPTSPTGALPTMLVDLSIPLLGQSPSAKDVSHLEGGVYSRPSPPTVRPVNATGFAEDESEGRWRERLRLDRGEFVCVVGWLEGDARRLARKVNPGPTYNRPLELMLEAIHVSASRPPPNGAVFRGSIRAWDGNLGRGEEEDNEQEMDETPKARRHR